MKRIGAILSLAALIVTMTVSVCFGAQSLEIVESYPTDGMNNTTKDNMCVKLWFNHDMDDEALEKLNADCVKITDPDGNEVPIRVFYVNPKEKNQVMVLADSTKLEVGDIKDDTEYTLTISEDFQDKEGNTLAKEETISFTTLNQGRSSKIYMIMMVIMFGGMFFFSSRQMKKQAAKDQAEGKVKEEPFNPYKEAKRTGKSVAEVMAAHEKEMEKKAAKEARKAARNKDDDDDDYEDDDDFNGNYKVKGPRPISEGGSSYITGRKALAEARKAEEERLAKRRAANAKKKKK